MHHIRRSILDALATAPFLRYSQLKPADLDGNVFLYHLKSLIQQKYVARNDAGHYQLTRKGETYIVHRYEIPEETAHSIFLIVIQRKDEFLLRQRKVQPLLGYSGFIHGEPRPDEPLLSTAKRRLEEKSGLKNIPLTIVGTALLKQYIDHELHSFSHAIIIYGTTTQDISIQEDETGVQHWASLDSVLLLLPSCTDILAMISKKHAFIEKTYDLERTINS